MHFVHWIFCLLVFISCDESQAAVFSSMYIWMTLIISAFVGVVWSGGDEDSNACILIPLFFFYTAMVRQQSAISSGSLTLFPLLSVS